MASVASLNWRADWINFSESAKFWDSEMFEILYPAMVVDSILSVLWWLLTLAIFRLWFRPPQDVYVLAILNLRIPCLRPETLARSLLTNHEGREQEMGPRGFKDGNEGFKYPLRRGRQRPEESCWTDISWFNGYVFLFSQNVSGKLVIIKNFVLTLFRCRLNDVLFDDQLYQDADKENENYSRSKNDEKHLHGVLYSKIAYQILHFQKKPPVQCNFW